jgi:hypothetical protein
MASATGTTLVAGSVSYSPASFVGTTVGRVVSMRPRQHAWLMGVGPGLSDGTDAGTNWFLAMVAIAVLPPLVLLSARSAGVQRPVKRRAGVPAG